MTERKPPGMDVESWVERQIREATERGAFDELAGRGKPLPDDSAPYDEMWWVKRKMAAEGVSLLPATLALRKQVEDALAAAGSAATEMEVRRIIAEVNKRIEEAMRRPMDGPPHGLVPYDVETVVTEWRAGRGAAGGGSSSGRSGEAGA
ncbi:DUF1992 domain-containing protein [Streptomyces alkaliterrae]|uniref:DUF1992 domain-containing protein n=1 Tax=Streptomyces alkaliterrae TaxID=2213162 RepID=A0A5P0YXX7_9ACTN|nr:DUF1992 domain-containing protein [Streptomyces alkaliterrae]MBB1256317.1 DUF1992 domain-containing protein [Streptomyces alkaliterrae]MBB1260755.1 DUF1992 domain-containing protein [Streptomyces alkaliterrae]MQS04850.1 DUF1992 domain-containing protein [Streptomyces alkaliterrae]